MTSARRHFFDKLSARLKAAAPALHGSYFARFCIVGTGGFTVDESILAVLHFGLGVDRYTARLVSIGCAATFTWWGNRRLTFHQHAAQGGFAALVREWARFISANAVGVVVNYSIYLALVTFGRGYFANPLLATVAGVAVGLGFNFTLSKYFVFRAAKPIS